MNKPKTSLGPLNNLITYQLRTAQSVAHDNFIKALCDIQITLMQFNALSLIASNPGVSQASLARCLGVERSSIVTVIDGLEEQQMVLRVPSQFDRRTNSLKLTDAGKAIFEQAIHLAQAADKMTTQNLSREETQQLLSLLKRIKAPAD